MSAIELSIPELPFTAKDISRKAKFTAEEDAQLSELVKMYGDDDWFTISCLMPGRNARQCRERWHHYLTPTVTSLPFTPEEDARLRQKFSELGAKWKAIAAFFPGRTDINIKNRWLLLARRNRRVESAHGDVTPPRPRACPSLPVPILVPLPQQAVRENDDEIPWSSDQEDGGYRDSATDLTGDYFCLNFARWE
jgi:hypothetical protein